MWGLTYDEHELRYGTRPRRSYEVEMGAAAAGDNGRVIYGFLRASEETWPAIRGEGLPDVFESWLGLFGATPDGWVNSKTDRMAHP